MKTPLLLTALALTLPACSLTGIPGSGTIQIQERSVPAFHSIAVRGSGEMLLSQGDVAAVSIECDDNLLEYIDSVVEGSTLTLGPSGANLQPSNHIIYRVVVTDLESIALSGSLRMSCPALRTEDLSIRTSGSGRIRIGHLIGKDVAYKVSGSGDLRLNSLQADSLSLKISGSGNVQVQEGSAKTLLVRISGSGNMGLKGLHTQDANISISGSGKAHIWADSTIESNISGSGQIHYWGTASTSASTSGSGKIKRMGNHPFESSDQ